MTSQLSEFDAALSDDVAAAMREQRRSVFSGNNVYSYSHGTRWHSRSTEESADDEDDEMQVHSMEVRVTFEEIVANDVGALSRYVNAVVSGMMQELMRAMYQALNESTEKTGNVVNAKGGGFKAEQFIEMLEKIEFGVDRNGNVSFPEIHAGPELAEKMLKELSAQGPGFEERVRKITQKKSQAALEKEGERKSRFPRRGKD
tara:strand:- start:510 stop:1115 length:606 start_codon:yes stop_codon:yes gene_type:complete